MRQKNQKEIKNNYFSFRFLFVMLLKSKQMLKNRRSIQRKRYSYTLNLPLSNCRGQVYDGAAKTKGNFSGVQARIKESNKTAVYVYSMGHQLNLVVQECITNTVERENALEILNKVSKFVTASPNKLESFLAFQLCMSET